MAVNMKKDRPNFFVHEYIYEYCFGGTSEEMWRNFECPERGPHGPHMIAFLQTRLER